MRKLIWLNSALNDLARLKAFFTQENPNAAKLAAGNIKTAVQNLVEHPLIGKPVKDLPEYRDLLIRFGAGGYILRYRLYQKTLYIVHIRHYREADFKIDI